MLMRMPAVWRALLVPATAAAVLGCAAVLMLVLGARRTPAVQQHAGPAGQARHASGISVATWNVWFGEERAAARQRALLGVLASAGTSRTGPDVIGLQEVLPAFADALREGTGPARPFKAFLNEYVISSNRIRGYGCLLLAKRSLSPQFREVALPTDMGRTLLVADLAIPGVHVRVRVGTVHLESLDNEPTRKAQLHIARAALLSPASARKAVAEEEVEEGEEGKAALAMLMGDFNFDATRTFRDWELPLDAPQRTRDTLENTVASPPHLITCSPPHLITCRPPHLSYHMQSTTPYHMQPTAPYHMQSTTPYHMQPTAPYHMARFRGFKMAPNHLDSRCVLHPPHASRCCVQTMSRIQDLQSICSNYKSRERFHWFAPGQG